MFTIALSSFPGLPIFLRRQHKAELRSYRLSDPSSRVGLDQYYYTKKQCKAVLKARGFYPIFR